MCAEYEYLGVILQATWTFTKHLEKRRLKAARATRSAKSLSRLSLPGSIRYFEMMIKPIMCYGVEQFWEDLSEHHFEIIDGCFFDFYKRVLGLHRSARNRKVLLMTDQPLLTESLVRTARVPSTPAYERYLLVMEEKLADLEAEFFLSPAMTQTDWREGNHEKRHLICRMSDHGFHHKLCLTDYCKFRSRTCVCRYCFTSCVSLLHALHCPRVFSLSSLDRENN